MTSLRPTLVLSTNACQDFINRFPLIINDVPTPPLITNNPEGQKLFIIRVADLLKGFSRAAFNTLLKSIKIELKSR